MRRLLALLALAACASPEAPPAADAPRPLADVPADGPAARPSDTLAERARAAGLTDAQAAELVALGVPVYVPNAVGTATLSGFRVQRVLVDGSAFPEYELVYTRPDGTCVSVVAASEGLGDVFVMPPPRTRTLAAPGVPGGAAVPFGWAEPGDAPGEEGGWQPGQAGTEWIAADALYLRAYAGGGESGAPPTPGDAPCPPAPAVAVAAVAESLRPLDPAHDALLLGPLAETDLGESSAGAFGDDPEALARGFFGPTEPGEGRQRTAAETLARADAFAVVLVTTTDLADDSVRDERLRVALTREPMGWTVRAVGRQVRCQPGRGAQDWTAGRCR